MIIVVSEDMLYNDGQKVVGDVPEFRFRPWCRIFHLVLSDLLKYVDQTEGQAWDDIIRVTTFASVGFDLFLKKATVHWKITFPLNIQEDKSFLFGQPIIYYFLLSQK